MRKIDTEELKQIELKLLQAVDRLCRKEGIRYYLSGGTLLGAVRHKGFIPWDDDIDIAMPRPDFDRFIDLCLHSEQEFRICCNVNEPEYGYIFAKAWMPGTILKEDFCNRGHVESGVYIDICPIDGLGDTYEQAIRQYRKTTFLRELLVASNWQRFFRSSTRPVYHEPFRFALYVLSRFTSPGKLTARLDARLREVPFESAKYCAGIIGAYRTREIAEHDVFSDYIELEFEGNLFLAPRQYDVLLTQWFGDYMTPPPIEKRETHHTFEAFYTDQNG